MLWGLNRAERLPCFTTKPISCRHNQRTVASHLNRINYGTSFQERAQNIRQGTGPMLPLTFLLFPRCTAQCACLQTMFLLELEVFFPQGVHAINHFLHKLDLRVAKTVLV